MASFDAFVSNLLRLLYLYHGRQVICQSGNSLFTRLCWLGYLLYEDSF